MQWLIVLLLVIEVVCCLLLIGVILLQKSKGEGLGLAFGAGMGESLFGSRAGNVLTRATVVLSIVFLLNTLALALLFSGRGFAGGEDSLIAEPPDSDPRPAAVPQPMEPAPSVPAPAEDDPGAVE